MRLLGTRISTSDMVYPVWVRVHGQTLAGYSGRRTESAVWVETSRFVGLVPTEHVTERAV